MILMDADLSHHVRLRHIEHYSLSLFLSSFSAKEQPAVTLSVALAI